MVCLLKSKKRDKIYNNEDFFSELKQEKNSIMMTPVKGIKGQCQEIKKNSRRSKNFKKNN